MVQWLGFCTYTARGLVQLGQGSEILGRGVWPKDATHVQ